MQVEKKELATCKGDSSGPLLIKGDDATSDIQIGVTSWSAGCASPYHPGVGIILF